MLTTLLPKVANHKIPVIAIVLGIILGVGVPSFGRVHRALCLRLAIQHLTEIETAKGNFAKDRRAGPNAAVMDAKDLVPAYLSSWPSGPPENASYAANSIGFEPTLNGLTRSQIEAACASKGEGCIF